MKRVSLFCRAVVAFCCLPAAFVADGAVRFMTFESGRDYTRDLMDTAFALLHTALRSGE